MPLHARRVDIHDFAVPSYRIGYLYKRFDAFVQNWGIFIKDWVPLYRIGCQSIRLEVRTLPLFWCKNINSVILEILTSFGKKAFNMKVVFLLLFCVPLVTSGR